MGLKHFGKKVLKAVGWLTYGVSMVLCVLLTTATTAAFELSDWPGFFALLAVTIGCFVWAIVVDCIFDLTPEEL